MINEFIDEVLSKGAEAVLPQHLNDEWLDRLYVGAKQLIDLVVRDGREGGAADEQEPFQDDCSMALMMAVMEIVQHQAGYPADRIDMPEYELMEKMKCYAMAIVFESISRISDLEMDLPALDNIFDKIRIIEFEETHPEITTILNRI
ncbi:MAG: hypothetical protein PHP23_02415 [Desulfobacterales bacterium]|nr:hypothetical protein [Desulfobacterales bacterium]MDD4071106.1 hypothetical protein [Desulfobacterales bacterium]MDD4393551.1 hypothetical protein [Desulfobacterales bacterium]